MWGFQILQSLTGKLPIGQSLADQFEAPQIFQALPGELGFGRVDLNQVHAPRHGGARPGNQLADAVDELGRDLQMVSSTSALSASSAAISSRISSGLRWATASPPLGFFTERSNVAGSMLFASTVQDLGESAKVFCHLTNSARSSSLSGHLVNDAECAAVNGDGLSHRFRR